MKNVRENKTSRRSALDLLYRLYYYLFYVFECDLNVVTITYFLITSIVSVECYTYKTHESRFHYPWTKLPTGTNRFSLFIQGDGHAIIILSSTNDVSADELAFPKIGRYLKPKKVLKTDKTFI